MNYKKFITNLIIFIFFRVSGDISCPYPFCKRKFQSQYEFTPRALEQHLENPGNWHNGKGNVSKYTTFT